MKFLKIQQDFTVPAIALGCMRLANLSQQAADTLLHTALEAGVTYFDHADIYGGGQSEERFGAWLQTNPNLRSSIMLQSKCGIQSGYYDFSKEHIITSVEGSLRRLQTDYLDALLLHRPDTLMEPEEVAEAFDILYTKGLVRHFGVSNHNAGQIKLLRRFVHQPLLFNQMQFGPVHTGMIDRGLHVNMQDDASVDHDGGLLEYCRLHDITLQPWSPYQHGFIAGSFLGSGRFPALEETLTNMAAEKQTTPTALVMAWILRHPANMQPIVGTTNPNRLLEIVSACHIPLSRPEWYEIYRAAGHVLP